MPEDERVRRAAVLREVEQTRERFAGVGQISEHSFRTGEGANRVDTCFRGPGVPKSDVVVAKGEAWLGSGIQRDPTFEVR